MNNNGLPHNIEAERSLIGSAFWSYGALQKVCEEVTSEVFYLDSHSKIFEVINSLYQDKKPVDASTVTTEIINRGYLVQIGGVEYLNSVIESVATGANVSYYIDTVIEKYTLRRMIEVATKIITNANKNDITVSEAVESAEKSILNISKLRKSSEFREIKEVLDKAQNDLESLAKNKGRVTGLTTGLIDLDNLTNGFSPTQLVIIAARPAVGKTAFALNIAANAAKSTKKNIAILRSSNPNTRSRNCVAVCFWPSSAMVSTSSQDSNSSMDTEKNFAIAFKDSILGYPLPDSHLETAARETKRDAASSSWVSPFCFRKSCNFS